MRVKPFSKGEAVKTWDAGNPTNRKQPGWWAAACGHCGEVLVKYGWTEEGARSEAESEKHECKP